LPATISKQPMTAVGHFRPIDDVCAMSVFHPIATKLLHYRKVNERVKTGLTHSSKVREGYAVRSIRVSISLRSVPKSIGLVSSASAPFSTAFRFVSASP
jgi:hypothetical protein